MAAVPYSGCNYGVSCCRWNGTCWECLKKRAVWLSAAQCSAVSQSVALHQARINPPPTSLLSRQTVTDVLRYKAIIYQPPRLLNPCCSTRQRHGKGSECDRLLKSEIATSVEHGRQHSARSGEVNSHGSNIAVLRMIQNPTLFCWKKHVLLK